MRTVTATFSDGTSHRFEGVPDTATPDEVLARLKQQFPGKTVTGLDGGRNPSKAPAVPGRKVGDMPGFMESEPQQAGWQHITDAGAVLPGDQLNPVPAAPVAPAAPEPELDPESQRHMNRAVTHGATADSTPRSRQLSEDAARQAEIDALKQEVRDLAKIKMAPVERSRMKRVINDKIAALEAQQSSDPYSTVGGTAGAVVGGLAGAPLGPGGGIVGSMGLGLIGTLVGAAKYARENNFTQQERDDYLKTKGIESIAFDAVGNLTFGTVKGVVHLAKGTPAFVAALKLLGGKVGRATGAQRIIGAPAGEKVFSGTTEAEFKKANEEAADLLNTGERAVPTSAFTGQMTIGEAAGRAKAPGEFAAAGREGKGILEGQIAELLKNIKGPRSREYAGTALRETLDEVEDAGKARMRPVWEELSQMRGAETVDYREVRDMARELLALNAKAKVKILVGEKLDWARRLAGREAPSEGAPLTFKGAEVLTQRDAAATADRMAWLSPGEAHDVLTKLKAIVRDADSPTAPNSEMRAFAQQAAGKLHTALDKALAHDPKFAEARDFYKRMMDTLYDPALAAARRGGESNAASRAVKVGEVEGLDALERVRTLASDLQPTGGVLADKAIEAHRGAVGDFVEQYAGTPEAMAHLHSQMAKPGFRRTFQAAVPDPANRLILERFSAAAQALQQNAARGGGGFGVEGAGATAGRVAGYAVGAPNTLSLVGRILAAVTTRKAAEAYTRPEMQVIMPRATAWLLNAARGAGRPLSEVPQEVRDLATALGIEMQGEEAR